MIVSAPTSQDCLRFSAFRQTGPVGGSVYGFARSFRCAQTFGLNIPAQNLRHILSALVANLRFDASQSPYPGRQNVVNKRNVRRHLFEYFCKLFKK
jgi:hypothetical protein